MSSASGAAAGAASRLDRLLAAASGGAAALGSLLVLALVLLVDADILGRELFAAPVRGVSELLALAIVAILFLQLPETLRAGRLARSELLLDRLRTARPRLAHALEAVIHAIGAVLFLLLAIAVAPSLAEAWREGLYVGAAGDFTAPLWPVRLVVVAGAGLTAVIFVRIAARELGRALGSRS
ncbi:MAG: TRAP transporter small permease subunit [Geminicoccaceae bacterium]|nr:TRAP transporter small permease subunit [Geminicoccaceae bacterium]